MAENQKTNVSKSILERLHALDNLPHFPAALVKLEKLLAADQKVALEEVVGLISQDPRLSAGVIGIVNSARYSPGFEISSIEDAVNRIGVSDVRLMAHTINYKSSIAVKPPFSQKEFMQHSMVAAYVAQLIARQVHMNQSEAFLAGLMHDIGIYLLATENREQYKEVIRLAKGELSRLVLAEKKVFGATHTVVGARLLKQWKFPNDVVMGVAGHHLPENVDEAFQAHASLTHLAEMGAFISLVPNGVVSFEAFELPSSTMFALEVLNLSEADFRDIAAEALQIAMDTGVA